MAVGIVVAAGKGARMGTLANQQPKCMLPIKGRPLLHHTIDRLRAIGCDKIVVVVGHKSEYVHAPNCTFIKNPGYLSNNILHSLMYARNQLAGEVVCTYSDIWLEPEILSVLSNTKGNIVAAVDEDWKPYYIGRTEHPISEAENVFYDSAKSIHRIGKQLQPDKAGSYKCGEFLGLWKMSSAGTAYFVKLFEALNNELSPTSPFQNAKQWQASYITDLFQEIIDRDVPIRVSLTRRQWAELDTRQDYDRLGTIADRQQLRTLLN
jgi:choline kinase